MDNIPRFDAVEKLLEVLKVVVIVDVVVVVEAVVVVLGVVCVGCRCLLQCVDRYCSLLHYVDCLVLWRALITVVWCCMMPRVRACCCDWVRWRLSFDCWWSLLVADSC